MGILNMGILDAAGTNEGWCGLMEHETARAPD